MLRAFLSSVLALTLGVGVLLAAEPNKDVKKVGKSPPAVKPQVTAQQAAFDQLTKEIAAKKAIACQLTQEIAAKKAAAAKLTQKVANKKAMVTHS